MQFYLGIENRSSWGELEGEGWGLEGVIKLLYKWVVMAAAGSTLLSKPYANTLEQLSPCATTTAHSRALKPQLRSPRAATAAAAAAKSLQSCPTLCDPIGGSPPGSAVLGILQARTLEWVCATTSVAQVPAAWAQQQGKSLH